MEKKSFEIRQINERETWIGENRCYLSKDNILHEIIVGDVDEKIANALVAEGNRLRNMAQGKVDLLIDLNRAGSTSSKARKIGSKRFEIEGTGKVAIFGMHPVARVIASFVIGISKKEEIRFFKTKEEAFAWLKEDN